MCLRVSEPGMRSERASSFLSDLLPLATPRPTPQPRLRDGAAWLSADTARCYVEVLPTTEHILPLEAREHKQRFLGFPATRGTASGRLERALAGRAIGVYWPCLWGVLGLSQSDASRVPRGLAFCSRRHKAPDPVARWAIVRMCIRASNYHRSFAAWASG